MRERGERGEDRKHVETYSSRMYGRRSSTRIDLGREEAGEEEEGWWHVFEQSKRSTISYIVIYHISYIAHIVDRKSYIPPFLSFQTHPSFISYR